MLCRLSLRALGPLGSAIIVGHEKTTSRVANSTAQETARRVRFFAAGRAPLSPSPRVFPPPTTNISSPSKGGFLAWYEGHLERTPIRTKMITGSFLWGIGDAVAQVVPPIMFPEEIKGHFQYDVPRTARAVAFGCFLHAPASHAHFNLLEWMTHKVGVTGLGIPVFKTVMEQFVYWSWISNSMYHGAMGAMQGMSADQVVYRIREKLWDMQLAQWKFWIPIQVSVVGLWRSWLASVVISPVSILSSR